MANRFVMLLNCELFVFGPLTTLQAPVPVAGALAASDTLGVVVQMVWSLPAFEALGAAPTVMVTLLVLAVQLPLLMVQRST